MKIVFSSCQGVLYKVLVPCRVTLGEGILLFWDKWKNKYTEVRRKTAASRVKEDLKNEPERWVQALKWHSVQISNTSKIRKWICTGTPLKSSRSLRKLGVGFGL